MSHLYSFCEHRESLDSKGNRMATGRQPEMRKPLINKALVVAPTGIEPVSQP